MPAEPAFGAYSPTEPNSPTGFPPAGERLPSRAELRRARGRERPRPRQREPRSRWRIAVRIVIAAVLAAAASLGGYAFLQHRERESLRAEFARADAAYQRGECAAAVRLLRPVRAAADVDGAVAAKARAEIAACEGLLAVQRSAQQSAKPRPDNAVHDYLIFLAGSPEPAMARRARLSIDRLWQQAGPRGLATEQLCSRITLLHDVGFEPKTRQAQAIQLLRARHARWLKAGDFGTALAVYQGVIDDPGSPARLAYEARKSLHRTEIARARQASEWYLPAPDVVGQDSDLGDRAELVIINSGRNRHWFTAAGGLESQFSIPPCEGCQPDTADDESRCGASNSSRRRLTVRPGKLTLLAELAPGSDGPPVVGDWTLKAGHRYSICFAAWGVW